MELLKEDSEFIRNLLEENPEQTQDLDDYNLEDYISNLFPDVDFVTLYEYYYGFINKIKEKKLLLKLATYMDYLNCGE